MFRSYNVTYETFSSIQKQKLFSLPAPSEFAKNWSQYQNKFKDRFLCFRPPNSRGLPLCTLHDVFRQYCIAVEKPIPDASETAISALRSASELCSSMGQSFSSKDTDSSVTHMRDDKENARVVAFDKCMHGVLDSSLTLKAKAELHSDVVDGALLVLDVPVGLREMKGEPGAGGDPYMQIVRSYDLSVKVLQGKEDIVVQGFLKEGAPMFLLCVSGKFANRVILCRFRTISIAGPELLVAGGFWDGKTVTVEPLGDPCIMFNDNGRVEKLARVLYALAIGVTKLKECSFISTYHLSSLLIPSPGDWLRVPLLYIQPLLRGFIGLAFFPTNPYLGNSPL